jgi:hypothetical protein
MDQCVGREIVNGCIESRALGKVEGEKESERHPMLASAD